MKNILNIFIFNFLCIANIFAGEGELIDTIKLSPLDIVSRNDFFSSSFVILKVDSNKISDNKSYNLGDLLSTLTPLQIQSNGSMGSASGAFIRGCNSYHTSVNWNGFPIGSVTLGTTDLSLINIGAIQEIEVVKSSPGSVYGNGSFGGSVNLKNIPRWNNGFTIEYNFLKGSYSENYNYLNLSYGEKNIYYDASLSSYNIKGDFPYHDYIKPYNPLVNTEHNNCWSYNTAHNIYFKFPSKINIEYGLWIYSKGKELPNIIGANKPSFAFQQDKSIKNYIKVIKVFDNSSLNYNAAYLYDFFKYTDKESADAVDYSVYSVFNITQLLNDLNYRYYINPNITIDAGLNYSHRIVNTNNYSHIISENYFAFLSGIKISYSRFISNLLFRQEFNSYYKVKPVYSLSFKYEILKNILFTNVNIGRNFRMPTLNDRYWKPGGNLDLLPEFGWNTDAGLEITKKINSDNLFIFSIYGYYKLINNIIQWLPDNDNPFSTIWTPKNSKRAWIRGIDNTLKYCFSYNLFKFETELFYNYNISEVSSDPDYNNTSRKKLMQYIPLHSANGSMEIKYKDFFAGYIIKYFGKRYTDEGNIEANALPYYTVSNFYTGTNFNIKKIKMAMSFKVHNIFNKEYQIVRAYPMPGRMFQISLKLGFQRKNIY